MNKHLSVCLVLATWAVVLAVGPAWGGDFKAPPGKYRTSWVGNSFGGHGGPNGLGYWVQNGADEIEVTPDGTVFAGVGWDEAGRAAGLYKDGKVNRKLLMEHDGQAARIGVGLGAPRTMRHGGVGRKPLHLPTSAKSYCSLHGSRATWNPPSTSKKLTRRLRSGWPQRPRRPNRRRLRRQRDRIARERERPEGFRWLQGRRRATRPSRPTAAIWVLADKTVRRLFGGRQGRRRRVRSRQAHCHRI